MSNSAPADLDQSPEKRRVFTWLLRWSDWKRWWQLALVLLVLYIPAFGMDQVMDDYHFDTAFRRHADFSLDMLLDSFNFGERRDADGVRSRNVPWWSDPDYKMRFLRPLSAFTLWVDFHLLSVPARHAHSLLWYGFLLWGLAGFYRLALRPLGRENSDPGAGVAPEKIAFLAWVLFAVNDAHTLPVAWIAHRSLVIAVGFAVWALRYFEAGLQGTGRRLAGPLFFCLALTGGEAALGILAYMALRVFFVPGAGTGLLALDLRTLPRRMAPLAPYAVIAGVYLILYSLGGFGTYASGMYLNPLREPGDFIVQFVKSWPVLMGALLGPLPAVLYGLVQVFPAMLWIIVPSGFLVVGLNWYYLRPFRDRTGAFLFGGAMLALVPASMAVPSDRLLMLAGIGVYPLIARFLLERRGWFWWALLIGHLLLSALNVPGTAQYFSDYGAYAREKITNLKKQTPPGTPANRKLVLVNGPGICLGIQFRHLYGAHFGELDADNFLLLANHVSKTTLIRIDATTIDLIATYPGKSSARIFRRENNYLQLNQSITKNFATIRVMELDASGWPARVRVQFSAPLNEIAFVVFWGDDFRYITPPLAGESIFVPAPGGEDRRIFL